MRKYHTILEAIKDYAVLTPEKLCLADVNQAVSYHQFWTTICAQAEFLIQKGLREGDYVVAKASQTVSFMALCHGVQLAGGIFVPVEKNASRSRIESILQQTCARFYVGEDEFLGLNQLSFYQLKDILMPSPTFKPSLPKPNKNSMILFTTGTTGVPKGIVLSYASEVAVAENVAVGVQMKCDNIEIIPMPMSHSFSLRRYYSNLIYGCSVVLIDGVVFVKVLFDMLDKYHATSIALNPSALSIIFKLSKDRLGDYKDQLDYVQLGSAPLMEPEKKRLLRLLPQSRLYNIYGSTEAGCSVCLNFNSNDNLPNCIGYATCHSIVKIVDAKGNEIQSSADNPGFLAYTGDMLMEGYFGDPRLTAETIENGFLISNDVGYIDAAGRVFMLGRVDDIISTGAFKVSPEEVEEVAMQYPGIKDCACIAIPDKIMGNVPLLCVSLLQKINIETFYKYLNENLDGYKCPKKIEILPDIPRSYNGKLMRKNIRKMYESEKQ